MATKPMTIAAMPTSADILNAIRNEASINYREYVPAAANNVDSIREVGTAIMQFTTTQNEFVNALVNRIGRVTISSKMYSNPWSVFKKGELSQGETIEEVFVNIIKPHKYNAAVGETNIYKREIPDVRAAFHTLNSRIFYKASVSRKELALAFLSVDGVVDLVTKITERLTSSANYDEFLVMKYMIAKNALAGRFYPVNIAEMTADNAHSIVTKIKSVSNNMEFMTNTYNIAGVHNFTPKDNQYIIVNSDFDATMDVSVLAAAFNMDKADFIGHKILVDSFGVLDNARLAEIFKGDDNYKELTSVELEAVAKIPAVLVDLDWWMVYDNMIDMTEKFNEENLYWNYWYHTWKTYSISPFANNAIFIPGDAPAVTAVDVTPNTVSLKANESVQFTVNVVTENFAPKTVNWSVDKPDKATVSFDGKVTLNDTVTPGDTIKVTATSTHSPNMSHFATITVVE